ncbi:MAG: glycosyltransferase family 2 protein [Xanthomonadaceae bacterium]|nr:glycosyltransferase family 2 protein [Xanthomonadaceae bacterium]
MDQNVLEQVTVVCVTHQSHALLDAMAETLLPLPRVIVVDNASSDGTAAALRQRVPHATVLERTSNSGFGSANNEAMALVRTPYALLLNPDCTVRPDDLHTLLATLQRYPTAAMVAPQSVDAEGRPQKSYRQAFYEKLPRTPYRVPDATCSTAWLRACCLLVRTEAFAALGGFDPNFFLYYEDDDLCLRARAAGYECLLEPAAVVPHAGGLSTAPGLKMSFRKHFHYARSRHWAIRRYQGSRAAGLYLAKTALCAAPVALLYLLLLKGKLAVRWLAWGASALASAFAPLANRPGLSPGARLAVTGQPAFPAPGRRPAMDPPAHSADSPARAHLP